MGSSRSKEVKESESTGGMSDAQIHETFRRIDKDGSGYIDVGEMMEAMSALGFGDLAQEDIERMVDSIDTTGERKIREHQFLHLMRDRMTQSDPQAEMVKAFRLFDLTGTGKITFLSLWRVARTLEIDVSEEVLREMIAELDTDGDGIVTESDFINGLLELTTTQH